MDQAADCHRNAGEATEVVSWRMVLDKLAGEVRVKIRVGYNGFQADGKALRWV